MFSATLNSSMRLVSRTRADPSLRVYRVSKSTFVASCVFQPHIYGTEMSHAASDFCVRRVLRARLQFGFTKTMRVLCSVTSWELQGERLVLEIEKSLPETALWGYFASILPIVLSSSPYWFSEGASDLFGLCCGCRDRSRYKEIFTILRKIWSSKSISINTEMRTFVVVFGFIASCFGVIQE